MRFFLLLSILLIFLSSVTAQKARPYDAYMIEENTYITNPFETPFGFIFSDNYYSSIYVNHQQTITTLISSPGCGRYMQLSPNKETIGFKRITEDGKQTPCLLHLSTGKTEELHSPVDQCGQVFFTGNGDIYFTIENELHTITQGSDIQIIPLGYYSNYVSWSPITNLAAFNNNEDQMVLINTLTSEKKIITDGTKGFVYPSFSPDGLLLSFTSLSGDLFIYNTTDQTIVELGKGGGCRWTGNNSLIFNCDFLSEDSISRADIMKFEQGQITNITNTPQISEMQPSICVDGKIMYQTYDLRGIEKISQNIPAGKELLYQTEQKLPVKFYSLKNTKADITVPGTVPYIHQVYDTPSWHYGYSSCAPTTSAMSFAYYNQLPPWPEEVDHGYSWDPHINAYGSYVADFYRYNELYYNVSEVTGGTTAYGGFGFMWNGTNSPNAKMMNYHENHYHTSNQLWTSQCTFANTTTEIDLGYVHPMCNYLTSGHLTLTIGYISGQHTLIFNDPYGNKNTPGYPSYDGAGAKYDWPGYSNGYQNLDYDGTHGGIAWTVKARFTETTYNDTIIDNNYYNHGFYVNNTEASSHQRYFRDFNVGYNGHTWYTMTDAGIPDICWVTWTPTLPQTGMYEVFAYIPSNGATTVSAPYKVYHNNGISTVNINQSLYSDEWVSLGTYTFNLGQSGSVYLGDSSTYDGEMIAYDAMWWSYRPQAQAVFTTSTTSVCPGETISFTSQSTNTQSYAWQFPGGTPSASTQANPIVQYNTAGTYSVTLTATGQYNTSTETLTDAIVVLEAPLADFAAQSTLLNLPSADAIFINNSTNANSYFWDFGDGFNGTDQNPTHTYNAVGTYTVVLVAGNDDCPDNIITRNDYITVDYPTGIQNIENDGFLYYHERKLHYSAEKVEGPFTLSIFSSDGKPVRNYSFINKKGMIDLSGLSAGLYICKWSDSQNKFLKTLKIVLR